MYHWFLLGCLLLSGCFEDEPVSSSRAPAASAQTIAQGFYDYELPQAEPVAPPVVEFVEPEPMASTIVFPPPQPLQREDQARRLRGDRQGRVNQALKTSGHPDKTKPQQWALDKDYQQWDDARFDESRSTLPVDRSRILTADMRIPAILEDAVNSQVGGRMIALVERDVYSPNGKHILLPAYTKIICHYTPLEAVGQSRLAVNCSRLIRPDGLSIALKDSHAADQAGRMGLIGDVDQRLWERYGAAFIVAGISALTQAGANVAKNQTINATANQLSQNIGQITADVMEQTLDLAPILSIPAGAHIQIIPAVDLVLRHPYEKKTTDVLPASAMETTVRPLSSEPRQGEHHD